MCVCVCVCVSTGFVFCFVQYGSCFPPFCMPSNHQFNGRNCEFYLVEYWIFLYFYKPTWALFCYSVVTWKSFDSFFSCFHNLFGSSEAVLSLGLIRLRQNLPKYSPNVWWIMSFSSLAGKIMHYSQPYVSAKHCSIIHFNGLFVFYFLFYIGV